MAKKKAKNDEIATSPSPERDFDAEMKDAEVMKDEDIPAASAGSEWHHLSPKKIKAAGSETLVRALMTFKALEGYGISPNLYENLSKEIQSLFDNKAIENEAWNAANDL